MKNIQQWKTTIIGLVGVVISLLVGFGVISADQTTETSQHANDIVQAVFVILAAVNGLIAMFAAKDKVE